MSDAKGDLTHKTGRKITNNFKQSAETVDSSTGAKTTKWTCENLKDVSGITKQSCVVVSYKARINTDAIVAGTEGNDNTVILNYSNDPMNKDGKGQTPPDKVKDYTYGLKINKVDLGTEAALDGAEFTIQATGADDGASTNLYVQQDGSLGKTPGNSRPPMAASSKSSVSTPVSIPSRKLLLPTVIPRSSLSPSRSSRP